MTNYAIAGAGLEGKIAFKYFSKLGHCQYFDEKKVEFNNFDKIPDTWTVIRSPGIPLYKFKSNLTIWSSTNEFFAKCPAPIIGVTGTKGKGTVCTMTTKILENAGYKVHLVGNIGIPALSVLDKIKPHNIVIFELSSFQLWDLKYSPYISVILPITSEHLDVHKNFTEYWQAKANIAKFQKSTDYIIYNPNNKIVNQIGNLSIAKKITYNNKTTITFKLQAPGKHNIIDANIAAIISKTYDKTITAKTIKSSLRQFTSLPHRLQFIKTVKGVNIYDDNFSSNFLSLKVALEAFPNNNISLICGGYDRGLNNETDIASVINNSTVKFVALIGQTAQKIAEKLTKDHIICQSLSQAVNLTFKQSKKSDILLMSPGAASFDMFDNFYQRGFLFQKLIGELNS
ncbi:MAG: UDP-N-acetylmuramoyl-L-alanine--D-glutamate ligase [Bifidobacteriaceae bacterium]|jgi:UDP-N-acetylmuramoylalanine--D-glutamate ligase|nr:UDP-N-acetylmuramoyl-L-alanine--D-glutamate ligase [Bifidobacteriaceae bacterium]